MGGGGKGLVEMGGGGGGFVWVVWVARLLLDWWEEWGEGVWMDMEGFG